MRAEKINLKKILSYLLIFTVFFTTVQLGRIRETKADTTVGTTQVEGLTIHKGDLSGNEIVVDRDAANNFICEFLPIGTSFTLEPKSGYEITEVTSSNPAKMSINPTVSGGKNIYQLSNINDYSDFILTVKIKNTATQVVATNNIKMRFMSDSSLQFGIMRVTLDDQTVVPFTYGQTDGNGNYVLPKVKSSINSAKIELLDKNGAPMTCTINGGTSNTVNLTGGDNIIKVTRTNQGVSKDYTLIITKKGQAKLQSLTPSAGTLSPSFNSDTYSYTVTVPTDQSKIAFTPTTVDNSSTVKINGSSVNSGSQSRSISLNEGNNEVDIVVTTKDGDTSTYTVNVTRTAQFRSAQLTGLALTTGSLTPGFNKGIYEYTAIVDNNVTSIGVTPTAEDTNATIKVNGKTVPSGATSPYISLDEGGNIINVVVTDSKGNSNTYVLNVTRRYPKDNVNLASLSVTDGTMSPKFDPETYLYSVKVPRYIEKVKVLFTTQNDKSKVKINGKEYTNGQSDSIKLDVGANSVVVEITSEDGTSTTTYKLSVIRGDIQGRSQWVVVGGNWIFYDVNGVQIKNEWVKYDNQWYFLDINGYRQTGWIQDQGNWYYLNKDGIMQKGWLYDRGYWYYLQDNGAMRNYGWYTYDGKWYLFNTSGQLQTGWSLYKGRWYFMDEHGAMQKGWVTNDKNKYYINDDGSMRTGWLYDKRVWYYFEDSGMMVRGWQTINGKSYYFDANGVMKTGMFFLDGQWINLNNM